MRTLTVLVLVALPALAESPTRSIELGGGVGAAFVRTTANPFSTYAMRARPLDVRLNFAVTPRIDVGAGASFGAWWSFVGRGAQTDVAAHVRLLVTPEGAWAGLRLNASLGATTQYATAGGPSCSYQLSFGSGGDRTTCTHWENEGLTGPEHWAVGGVGGLEAQVSLGRFFIGVGANGRVMPVDTLRGMHAGWITADGGLRFGGAIGF